MTPQYSLLFHFLLISCLEMSARGRNVSLRPGELPIEVGSWAEFNCTLPCDHRSTHTLNWFIGSSGNNQIYLTLSGVVERQFTQRTGINITLQDMSDCDSSSGYSRQRLRVYASNSTAHLVNGTAVQCAALRKDNSATDLYSLFKVIEVNGDPTIPTSSCGSNTSTSTTPTAPTPQPSPSPCPTATTATATVIVTAIKTVTETVRVLDLCPTQEPGEPAGSGQPKEFSSNSASRTVSQLSTILLTLLFSAVSLRYLC